MKLNQTICALATPPLISALAIIRVSGSDALEIGEKIFSKPLLHLQNKEIVYGKIVDDGNVVDEVILLVYRAPKSFTGEDVIEIISHGSPLICAEILDLLIKHGARLAEKGEFSMRGYLNHKFDLVQAEAINDMIHSTTKEAKNLSLLSLEGKTTSLILPIKEQISNILAHIEVNIDFPEYEDIEEITHSEIKTIITSLLNQLDQLIKTGNEGKIIKNGIKVALVGKPNVGKSSLLNAILNEDKAIVTEIAGTTRDIVEGELVYKGIPMNFFDTAGIRESENTIEKIGIQKTKNILRDVDFVVYLQEPDVDHIEDEDILSFPPEKLIVVTNKKDLVKEQKANMIYISALNKDFTPLFDELFKRLNISQESFVRPSFNNERQLAKLKTVNTLLEEVKQINEAGVSLDLISVPLQSAYQSIIELLGGEFSNDLSEEIFSRFCVGK